MDIATDMEYATVPAQAKRSISDFTKYWHVEENSLEVSRGSVVQCIDQRPLCKLQRQYVFGSSFFGFEHFMVTQTRGGITWHM